MQIYIGSENWRRLHLLTVVDKKFYLINTIDQARNEQTRHTLLFIVSKNTSWTGCPLPMPINKEDRTQNTKSMFSDAFLSSALVYVAELWLAQSPPENLFKLCKQHFYLLLNCLPGTEQSEERLAGLAVQQKSFLYNCPQSLVGREVGRCRNTALAELGEVFFCTHH